MKGRRKNRWKGGGVGLTYRKKWGLNVEALNLGGQPEAEDVAVFKLERTEEGKREMIGLIVVFMTVDDQKLSQSKKKGEFLEL